MAAARKRNPPRRAGRKDPSRSRPQHNAQLRYGAVAGEFGKSFLLCAADTFVPPPLSNRGLGHAQR